MRCRLAKLKSERDKGTKILDYGQFLLVPFLSHFLFSSFTSHSLCALAQSRYSYFYPLLEVALAKTGKAAHRTLGQSSLPLIEAGGFANGFKHRLGRIVLRK